MAAKTQMLSNWHRTFDGLSLSTQQFYAAVEGAIRTKGVPDAKLARVEMKEGGMFSGKREYLCVKRGDLTLYICGAQFGSGFFVSSRLLAEGSLLDGILGDGLVKWVVKPDTFYKADSTQMYLSLMHGALTETIDSFTSAQHLPKMPDEERRPIMRDFYQ